MLFMAQVTLTNDQLLPPLTVIADDKKEALTRFMAYLKTIGEKEKKIFITERPDVDLEFFGYVQEDLDLSVRQHPSIGYQS